MELAVSVVTLFPELVAAVGKEGVTGRAVDKGIIALQMFNPRDYAVDRHRTVDDRPYGGGPGMVMQAGPLVAAIDDAAAVSRNTTGYDPLVVYLSPQGRQLDHQLVVELGGHRNLLLVAGRYEGHAAIARWRRMQSLGRTKQKRPELLDKVKLTKEDQRLLELYFIEHGSTKPEKT